MAPLTADHELVAELLVILDTAKFVGTPHVPPEDVVKFTVAELALESAPHIVFTRVLYNVPADNPVKLYVGFVVVTVVHVVPAFVLYENL